MALVTSVCEDENFVCILHINRYCTHLVAFLVSFVHPILSGYQNQTSIFILVSVFIS